MARVSIIIDTTEEGVVDGPADKVARKFVDGGRDGESRIEVF